MIDNNCPLIEETIKKHLATFGSTKWLTLGKRLGIEGSNKQVSDKVRKLAKRYSSEYPKENVLIIGDLHLPFELEGYLDFCKKQQQRFKCGTIIFIGDIIDNHYSSYHDTNADGYSAGQELQLAIDKLKNWYQAFPDAIVTIGNHDRLIHRKNTSSGVSKRWIKPFNEVLEVPNWKFVEEFIHNDILFVHGEQSNAYAKATSEFKSVVSGHLHTEGYVKLLNGGKNFAMQVGTGIDFSSYAFSYAQRGKQPILSCGVISDNTPIIIPFNG